MRSRVPKVSKRVRESPLFPLLRVSQKKQAKKLYVIGRVLRSVPRRLPGCWFTICEPICAWINGFCKFSCCVLGPMSPTYSLAGFLKFHLIIKKLTRTKVFGKHIYTYTSIFINYMYSLIYAHILILVYMSIHICGYTHI